MFEETTTHLHKPTHPTNSSAFPPCDLVAAALLRTTGGTTHLQCSNSYCWTTCPCKSLEDHSVCFFGASRPYFPPLLEVLTDCAWTLHVHSLAGCGSGRVRGSRNMWCSLIMPALILCLLCFPLASSQHVGGERLLSPGILPMRQSDPVPPTAHALQRH